MLSTRVCGDCQARWLPENDGGRLDEIATLRARIEVLEKEKANRCPRPALSSAEDGMDNSLQMAAEMRKTADTLERQYLQDENPEWLEIAKGNRAIANELDAQACAIGALRKECGLKRGRIEVLERQRDVLAKAFRSECEPTGVPEDDNLPYVMGNSILQEIAQEASGDK